MKYPLLIFLTALTVGCSSQSPRIANSALQDVVAQDSPVDGSAVVLHQQALTSAIVNANEEPVAPQTLATAQPLTGLPTLVQDYRVMRSIGGADQPEYADSMYRPRQLVSGVALETSTYNPDGLLTKVTDAASYNGWDLLLPRNNRSTSLDTRPDWFAFTLIRPATVAVGLRSKVKPSWLNEWTPGTSLQALSNKKTETIRVFKKNFGPGLVNLGGVAAQPGGENAYVVLLAEQNGLPSLAPAVPAGKEVPTPNAACPAWVHNQYTTTGPDGKLYPTWHPQIDPVYWCSFGHDHGSDPSLAGPAYRPAFGYTGSKAGMAEPHNGFKVNVFRNPSGGWWIITQHFGTGGIARTCMSMHTVDVALVQQNVIEANLHFMGDFGRGQVTKLQTTMNITGCGIDQATLKTTGVRKINLADNKGYEPWRLDASKLNIGLKFNSLVFDTGDALTACATVECHSLVSRPSNYGVDHRLTHENDIFVTGSGSAQGKFYSDSMGIELVAPSTPGAVEQYIQPNLNVVGKVAHSVCFTGDAWRGLQVCGGKLMIPDKALEKGIGNAN